MNDHGNFLLFDGILSLFLVFLILFCIFSVFGVEEDFVSGYDVGGECMDLLCSLDFQGGCVLVALSEGDGDAAVLVCESLEGRSFVLSDLTLGRVLVSEGASSADVACCRRYVGGHLYELRVFL